MDIRSLKPPVNQAPTMFPHLSPSSPSLHHLSYRHHKPQQHPLKDDQGSSVGDLASCHSSSLVLKMSSVLDAKKQESQINITENGTFERKSCGLLKEFGVDKNDRRSADCQSLKLASKRTNIAESSMEDNIDLQVPTSLHEEPEEEMEEEEYVMEEEEEDEDSPVECAECGLDFSTMQEYVDHACVVPRASESRVRDLVDEGEAEEEEFHIAEGRNENNLSDVESFNGKIVYNPDGSAYIIEDSDSDSGDLDALDMPKLDGAIVDWKGSEFSNTNPVFPQIASAVFVPKNQASTWSSILRTPLHWAELATPMMHSFRVYNVRNPGGLVDSDFRQLEGNISRYLGHEPLAKPILMCFICKLSFGYAKSFMTHATVEHNMSLIEEEKKVMARPKASAIIQGVGKQKEPLMSFLGPLPVAQSSNSSSRSFHVFFPNSASTPINKCKAASTSVSYVYTKPKMSKDVTNSPSSDNQDQNFEDSNMKVYNMWPPHIKEANTILANSVKNVEEDEEAEPAEKMDVVTHKGFLSSSVLALSPAHSDASSGSDFKPEPPDAFSTVSQDVASKPGSPLAAASTVTMSGLFGTCEDHPQGRAQDVECPKCDMILSSSQSLGGHMTMMHSRNSCKTLKCPKCNWHYKYQETLEIHMKEKHPDNEAQCIYCLTNQSHPRLARGETYSCGYKPYRCEVCNYSTTTKGNLSIHMQSDKHMNNMQELANGSSEMKLSTASSQGQGQTKGFPDDAQFKKVKPKQSWRCDVCNYETMVARNLRIHMTSEKHTHNMMVLQQNMKHMQRDMQLQMNQLMMMGQQDPTMFGLPSPLPPGLYPYDQTMLMPGTPPGFDLPVGLPRENGSIIEEAVTETSDASKLFQCCICNLHFTDSLDALHQHLQLDRTKQRESENIHISNGTYMCNLCTYKTNLKANFQLHCKTDKHVQRLQMVNHIKEGGPSNEWRLGFLNASNPTQVRCNACNFYTSSVHKLQVHAGSIQHDSNAHVFRLLQLALACLQSSAGSSAGKAHYYRCVMCGCNARTKQAMVQHARTIKHLQHEQTQVTVDPREVFLAVTLHDGETVVYEYDEIDGEERSSDGGYNLEGTVDTADKLDISGGTATISTCATTTTTISINNNNNNIANNNTSIKSEDVNSTIFHPEESADHKGNPEDSTVAEEQVLTKESSVPVASIPATTGTQVKLSSLQCPLCQDKCLGLATLEQHLAHAHKVTPEGLQKILCMVTIPMATLTGPDPADNAGSSGSSPHGSGTDKETPSIVSAAVGETTSSEVISSCPALFTVDEAKDVDIDKLESEHLKIITEDAIECMVHGDKNDSVEDQYRCQTCSRTFINIDQLYAHQNELGHLELKQTPRGPGYLCWKKGCNQYFKTAQALQVHFREIHARRNSVGQTQENQGHVFKCGQCSLAFKTEGNFQLHFLYHLAKAITQCSICQIAFASVHLLRDHLNMTHSDLSPTELENLHKTVDLNISMLSNSPGCEKFLSSFLETESDFVGANVASLRLHCEGANDVLATVAEENGNPEKTATNQKMHGDDTEKGIASRKELLDLNGLENKNTLDSAQMMMKELAEKAEREDEEAEQLELLRQSFPDQQSLEDFINSQAMAEGNYEDPARKFKCHRCKVGFTKQSYLTTHNKTQQHRRGDKISYTVERYLDPNRPYKCDICKESFTQKNILVVHYNSVSHLHKMKQSSLQGTLPSSVTSAQVPASDATAQTNGSSVTSADSPSERKSYRCNICKVAYSQATTLEIHLRSVSHQTKMSKIHELVMAGQVSVSQPLIEQPDVLLDLQSHQMLMEALQQQQLSAVTNQSLFFQALPTLNSMPMIQGLPQLLPSATSSLLSPSTAALASFASAAHLESEKNREKNQNLESPVKLSMNGGDRTSSNYKRTVTSEQQTVESHELIKLSKTEPECSAQTSEVTIKKEIEIMSEGFSDDANQQQFNNQRSDLTPRSYETGSQQQQANRSTEQLISPTLAASIPVAVSRPRGFMGRFKPQIHRNLLENIGFECVMQFNEYSQAKRKEREEEKEVAMERPMQSFEKKIEKSDESFIDEKTVNDVEEEKENKVDLPEINRCKCIKCDKEFSSVFVLKAHEEEVHKSVVPIGVVEDFGEKFKTDFDKKQPKPEAELPTSTSASTQVLQVPQPTTSSAVTEKLLIKVSGTDMPPPPPPHSQLSTAFDMAQMMPMLSLMPMPLPMNLMSLGMQPSIMSMMPGTSLDMQGSYLPQLNLGDPNIMSAQQQMQQAAAAAAAQNQKRVRTRISDEQLKILRAHFDINNSPSEVQINQMSEQSGLPQKVIKHWFRNTLFKERQRNKDSPYNFNNPPSTTIDFEEYEKTGKIPAVKVEPSDDDEECIPLPRHEEVEAEPQQISSAPPTSKIDFSIKNESNEDKKDYDSHSNASSPSNMSSFPSTPACSAPPTPTPTSTPASIIEAHAAALARESAAQASLSKRANRTRFTDYQIKMLQEYFEQNAYPKDDELDHLSKLLNLSPRVIVVWFQNARQKARKIYENQPPAESKDSNSPFQRTPSLNYQCKKCSAVFQRYYELIKHQKRPCVGENNNNKLMTSINDEDSMSSSTSFDDSVLSDSMSMSSVKDASTPSIAAAFRCDKCNASFNRIDLWQEHLKVHNMNPSLFPPFSCSSAFGVLQSLAQQEDTKSLASPASPSSSTNKRKIELEEDRGDDQPRDKRLRTTILPEQLDYLYQKYQVDCNPSRKQLETIAQEVGLKKRVVQVWFQNTRARERKGHYRAHQQLIHKRCPFCRALFRAKSALESHLATKHPEEMAKGEINIDAIPDAALESPQPAHSMTSTSTMSHSVSADLSKILSPSSMQPYLSFMPPVSLSMGFPSPVTTDPLQLSMKQIYEDSYKKYISELSGAVHPPKVPESLVTPRYTEPPEKSSPSVSAVVNEEDTPLDLSIPIKHSSSSSDVSSKNSRIPVASTSSNEKTSREHDRNRHNSLDDSFSETYSEMADTDYQSEFGSSPPSPRNSSGHVQNKRYRTQMTSLQVRVMKMLFIDYKTPTMAECELLGREIGLPKRVVQVWFQNARAKEKKSKLAMSKSFGSDVDVTKTPEECTLCNFKYSHKFTVQDHIFTRRHIDNVKTYIQSQSDAEREITDPSGMSGLLRQQSREMETSRKLWDKAASTSSAHVSHLQGPSTAAAFGLPGVSTSLGLGAIPLLPELSKKSQQTKDETPAKDKKNEVSSTSKDHHHQQQQQQHHHQQQQHAAELAQMMALSGYLPSMDPSYLSFMYTGLPSYFPGMAAMPLLQPGLLPGAEHLMAYDPLSFGTPLPLLQIPSQAIKSVSDKVRDSNCSLAQYTQDCKMLSDLKNMVSTSDYACAGESPVDVGYICKKCQMVYPAREACVTHQRTVCYIGGGEGGKSMVKLEQIQYECRVCVEKLSTLYEYKLHCQLDTHKTKVHKLGLNAFSTVTSSHSSSKPSLSFSFSDTSLSYTSGLVAHSNSSNNRSLLSASSSMPYTSSSKKSTLSSASCNSSIRSRDKDTDAKRSKMD